MGSRFRAAVHLAAALVLAAVLMQMGSVSTTSADALTWARQFGTGQANWADDVGADSTGVYVIGQVTTLEGTNGFLTKYDPNGNRLWSVHNFAREGRGDPQDVSVGRSAIYVSAFSHRTRAPQPFVLRRFRPTGALVWREELDPYLYIDDLAVDPSGLYLTGTRLVLHRSRPGHPVYQEILAKFDQHGSELWLRRFGAASCRGDLAVGPEGIAIAGGTTGLGSNQAPGGGDACVRLLTPDGQPVWSRQFGTMQDDSAAAVAIDGGGIYVSGDTSGTPGTSFVRKFNLAGESLWHHRLSSSLKPRLTGAAPAAGGGVIVTGWGGDLSGAPTTEYEGFVRRYDADGNVESTTYLPASHTVILSGIAVSSAGSYVAGATEGSFPGQWQHGDEDALVARVG